MIDVILEACNAFLEVQAQKLIELENYFDIDYTENLDDSKTKFPTASQDHVEKFGINLDNQNNLNYDSTVTSKNESDPIHSVGHSSSDNVKLNKKTSSITTNKFLSCCVTGGESRDSINNNTVTESTNQIHSSSIQISESNLKISTTNNDNKYSNISSQTYNDITNKLKSFFKFRCTREQIEALVRIPSSCTADKGWWRGGRETDKEYEDRCNSIVQDTLWSNFADKYRGSKNCMLITHGKLLDGIFDELLGLDAKRGQLTVFLSGGAALSCVELKSLAWKVDPLASQNSKRMELDSRLLSEKNLTLKPKQVKSMLSPNSGSLAQPIGDLSLLARESDSDMLTSENKNESNLNLSISEGRKVGIFFLNQPIIPYKNGNFRTGHKSQGVLFPNNGW